MKHGAETLLQELHVGILSRSAHLFTHPEIETVLYLERRLLRGIRAQGTSPEPGRPARDR
jgi:hypothetical protein